MRTLCIAVLLVLPITLPLISHETDTQQDEDKLVRLCTVQSSEICENSGIVLAKENENAIWTHNDSGGEPIVYLFSHTTGKTLATASLKGADNIDWEDIAGFEKDEQNYLVAADIGDNLKVRENYQLMVFKEPKLDSPNHEQPEVQNLVVDQWTQINFRYSDGSRNCEAISFDMENRQIIIFEKVYIDQDNVPGIYILDLPEELNDDILTARRVAELPVKNITAMDISSDNRRIVARTYAQGLLFVRQEDQSWEEALKNNKPKSFALPFQRQGEGVCFSHDETAVLCSSEFKRAPIWQVRIKDTE